MLKKTTATLLLALALLAASPAEAEARGKKEARASQEAVYELARFEGDNIRAVGVGRSYLLNVALENAESAAAEALARRLQTSIDIVRRRHTVSSEGRHNMQTTEGVTTRVLAEVSQNVSYVTIGKPSVVRGRDKTYEVHVCVQLVTDMNVLLRSAYDALAPVMTEGLSYEAFAGESAREAHKLPSARQ